MKYISKTSLYKQKGFSLAEVAIAVAIAALGITSILGLIPSGLNNLREAGNKVAVSRICQQMIGELQGAEWGVDPSNAGAWSKLNQYHNALRYFDSEGTPIPATGNLSARLSYVAKFELLPANVSLPGAAGAAMVRRDMKRVIIHVAVTPFSDFNFDALNSRHEKRAFTVTRQF